VRSCVVLSAEGEDLLEDLSSQLMLSTEDVEKECREYLKAKQALAA
jgi:hypothetical protein